MKMPMPMTMTTDLSDPTVLILSFEKLDPSTHLEWQSMPSTKALPFHFDSF
jgi:hypothetical protein